MVTITRKRMRRRHRIRRLGTLSWIYVVFLLIAVGFVVWSQEPHGTDSGSTTSTAQRESSWLSWIKYHSSNTQDKEESGDDGLSHVFLPKLAGTRTLSDLTPSVKYVGVSVDAGRHYFPIRFIKILLDYMYKLRMNYLHLRLTDDQAFAVRLSSHPELALPAPDSLKVYRVNELRELVEYAKKRGITIVPEINMPGHAGGFQNVPGIIVPCPNFVCERGSAIPLNVTHPKLKPILRDILQDVRDIFSTSPYIHLGKDDVHLSQPCFHELGLEVPDSDAFQATLTEILDDLKIPLTSIIRWEPQTGLIMENRTVVGPIKLGSRNTSLTHYWFRDLSKFSPHVLDRPFFASTGLYMDTNEDAPGWDIYHTTRRLVDLHATGIVVGTFELSPKWWEDRNVWGRMIAVAMGASKKLPNITSEADFSHRYETYCSSLGLPKELCEQLGQPKVPTYEWQEEWKEQWDVWKKSTCERLTVPNMARVMNIPSPLGMEFNTRQGEVIDHGQKLFVGRFGRDPYETIKSNPKLPEAYTLNMHGKPMVSGKFYLNKPEPRSDALFQHTVGHTGVMVDTARFFFPLERLKVIIDWISRLGFNTLHLRLTDDSSFAIKLKSHPDLAWAAKQNGNVYTVGGLTELAEYAEARGVEILPEINIISRAGGWYPGGFVIPCPIHICQQGYDIPLNLTIGPMYSVISNIIYELRSILKSPLLHLGFDEREEARPCLKEARADKFDFDVIERKLKHVLLAHNISPLHVIRWESSDADSAKPNRNRAGRVTHYHLTNPPANATDPFFVTTELRFDDMEHHQDDNAWVIYQKVRSYAQYKNVLGILAGTMELSPQTWSGLNIDGRLIAMAIGLSTKADDTMTEDEFRDLYSKTCRQLHFENDMCSLYGKARLSADIWAKERMQQRLVRQE